MEYHHHRVIWVPVGADSLEKRLLVCSHLEGDGHRGDDATMARLERHCVWERGKTLPHFTVRSGCSSVQAGQAPQAPGPLDRTVACCQRRQRARVRSVALGHSRTAQRPRGEDAIYADGKLEITGELGKVFQQLENQGEYHTRRKSAIKRAARSDEFVLKVAWEGLEEAENTWEPVSRVFHDAPAVLRKELKVLRLKAEQKRALVQRYGLRL